MDNLTIDKATLARLLDVDGLGLANGRLLQLAQIALDWWPPVTIEAANGGFVLTGLADLPRADKRELLEGNPLEALLTYPKTWGFPFGAELVGRWVKNWEQSAD